MSEDTAATERLGTLVKQQAIAIVLIAALVGLQAWQLLVGTSVKAQSWEYSIEAPRDEDLAERLRFLGSSGWEIVSARRATSQVRGETVAAYEIILRRPAAEAVDEATGLPTPAPPK